MRGAGPDEDLVDLAGLARSIWAGRRWIAAIMAAFVLLAIMLDRICKQPDAKAGADA